MDRKIAMATIRGISAMESVEIAHQCGLAGIEIQTDYLPEEEKECDCVFARIEECGMEVNLHAPSGDINISAANRGISKESVAQIKMIIDLAKKYQVRNVTFHPGRLSSMREDKDKKWDVLLNSVEKIAAYAKEQKVYVSIENMENRSKELVMNADDLNRFEPMGSENEYFGVTLDFSHFATNGILSPNLKQLKLPIRNVHISQCVDKKPHLSLETAEGEVRLCEMMKELLEIEYQGMYVLEVKGMRDVKALQRNIKILEEAIYKDFKSN